MSESIADNPSEADPSSTGNGARPGRAPRLLEVVAAGLCVGIVGSLLVGLAETLLIATIVSRKLTGETIPPELLVATLGRNALTHALLWCPVMIVLALGYWAVVARRRPTAAPIPALAALFVVLAGTVVVCADLELARRATRGLLVGACVFALVLGAIKYLVARSIDRKFGPGLLKGLARVLTVLSLLLMAVTGVVFARSPMFSPATWRVPASSRQHARHSKPNVLWIVLDTARADRMSCHGYGKPTTPFLDEWADQSVVCDLVIANGMWTVPAHASMLSGLSLREHGTDHRNLWLDDSIRTVADVLADNGYAAALFSNNPLVSPDTNLTKGFQTRRIVYHLRRLNRFSLELLCERWGITPLLPWLDQDFGAALTNYSVARWLDKHADAPKFVFINYMETHLPYRVPQRYRRMFLDADQVHRSYDLRHRVYGNLVTRLDLDYNISGPEFLSASDRELLERQYDAAIRYLDDRVREAIELFERCGLLDNTLVVITSDHGEYLGTHGMWGHRFLTYQDLARVAFLIREPGRHRGARVSTPVQLSDLYATVLNATIQQPGGSELRSSRDLLAFAARGGAARIAICECGGPAPVTMPRFDGCTDPLVLHRTTPQIAAVGQRFKLIESADGRTELYDLHEDPGELHNVIDVHPDQAERLAAYIRDWLETTPEYTPPAGAEELPSPEVLESLRSLGYVGDDE